MVEIPEVMGAVDVASLARGIAQSSGVQEIEVEDVHAAPANLLIGVGKSAVLRITLEAATKDGKTLAQNGTVASLSTPPIPVYVLTPITPSRQVSRHIHLRHQPHQPPLHPDLHLDTPEDSVPSHRPSLRNGRDIPFSFAHRPQA